jgi:hypothetical protein
MQVRVLSPRPVFQRGASQTRVKVNDSAGALVILSNGKASGDELLSRLPREARVLRKPAVSGPAPASIMSEIADSATRCLVLLGD